MEEKNRSQNEIELNESNEAKRQRLLGIENDSKIHEESRIIEKGNFFKNLWYRHKWAIIITAIFIVIGIVFLVQILNTKKYDMTLMYAGPQYINVDIKNSVDYSFGQMLDDYNEDGEKNINFAYIMYQNEEQRKKAEESLKNKDEYAVFGGAVSDKANYDALQSIQLQVISGNTALFLMDEALYKMYESSFMDVNELLGYDVDKSMLSGKSGVYLKSTDFYKHMSKTKDGKGLTELPDDTVICVLPQIVTLEKELHEDSVELFKVIMSFKAN